MLRERIKTSPLVPKIIFYLTLFLGALCVILAYMFIFVDAQVIVNEASHFTESINELVGVNDEIEATLNP